MLPGDQLGSALERLRREGTADGGVPAHHERERGNLDPQTVAEFLAYDIPFRIEPATGFYFPAPAEDD